MRAIVAFEVNPIFRCGLLTLRPYVPTTGSYDSCFRLMAGLGVASTLSSLLSAVFAVQVIRSIRARQGEELRRVEAAAELASASSVPQAHPPRNFEFWTGTRVEPD